MFNEHLTVCVSAKFYQGFRLKDIFWEVLRLHTCCKKRTVRNGTGQLVHTTNASHNSLATTLTNINKGRKVTEKHRDSRGSSGRRYELNKEQPSYVKGRKGGKKCLYISLGVEEEKGEGKEGAMKSTFSSQSPYKNPCVCLQNHAIRPCVITAFFTPNF